MILHVVGSHVKQVRALVWEPEEYSKKCDHLNAREEFKVNPNIKTLRTWWITQTVTSEKTFTPATSSGKKSLFEELESSASSEDESSSRDQRAAVGVTRKLVDSLRELAEDQTAETSHVHSSKKKAKNSKKSKK